MTAKKAFDKFGPQLMDPLTDVIIHKEPNMKVKHEYKISQNENPDLDILLHASPHQTLTLKIRNAICAVSPALREQ